MERIDKTHAHGFPGIWIPIEILMHPSLTPLEKMLFGIIKNLSSTAKGCWASNRYLGAMFAVTPQTASKSISNLIKFHFIIAEYTTLKSPINGVRQLRTLRINPEYEYLYQGMTSKVLESLSTDVRSLKENLKGYENPLDPLKENLNTPLRKILNKDTNKEFNEKEKIYKKESSSKKSVPENLKHISFQETLQYIPSELKDSVAFMAAWKKWFRYRKLQTPKTKRHPEPLTKKSTISQISKFKGFSIEEIIAALQYADDENNLGAYPRHNIFKGKSEPASTPVNQPEPIKYAQPIVDYLLHFRESVDIDLINQEVNKGVQYTESCYKKQETYEKKATDDYQYQYARRWFQNLPNLEEIIKSYIESIHWIKDPSERLFLWDSKMFKEFRYKLQKEYHKRSWETGELI